MSNAEAIAAWATMPAEAMDAYDEQGDFVKRHLLNENLVRLLGPISNRKVLDAGCGHGYFSRLLAGRGAQVVGVEPADALYARACDVQREQSQAITYHQADLSQLPDVGQPFDAVVCSMVLQSIPGWRPALKACVDALRPGGRLVFSLSHPAFENLLPTWRKEGRYTLTRYLTEYELVGGHAIDFHRPLSTYLNEVTTLGCRIVEVCEPALSPEVAAASGIAGMESHVDLPNFIVVAVDGPPATQAPFAA